MVSEDLGWFWTAAGVTFGLACQPLFWPVGWLLAWSAHRDAPGLFALCESWRGREVVAPVPDSLIGAPGLITPRQSA